MHASLLPISLTFALALCACATSTSSRGPLAPVTFSAVLQPGCALPDPALLVQAPVSSGKLQLQVDGQGRVVATHVARSTGHSDIDRALLAAAERCRFSPAYIIDVPSFSKQIVSSSYAMEVQWSANRPMVGAARCFRPDYSHAARRSEEEGPVVVQYRRLSSSGQVEASVRPGPLRLAHLDRLSLDAVTRCLDHADIKSSLPADKLLLIAYDWRLEL